MAYVSLGNRHDGTPRRARESFSPTTSMTAATDGVHWVPCYAPEQRYADVVAKTWRIRYSWEVLSKVEYSDQHSGCVEKLDFVRPVPPYVASLYCLAKFHTPAGDLSPEDPTPAPAGDDGPWWVDGLEKTHTAKHAKALARASAEAVGWLDARPPSERELLY